ncbi:hypothetical protein L7F22_048644 [Adiantum nelumboides]|nr:hypothetical protein [Adiantum nelumboides]
MGEPSSSWQNFNFRDDEGSAQGMQALRLLLAKLQEAQANPRLKPSVNNLLMTEDLMLTSTQRLPSSVAPMHLEGGEGVPVMHGPIQANVVPHPLQGPLQTDGAKKKQYHGQERHVGKIREEGDFHDDDDEPPSRSRHKKRTNERCTKRSRRNSSGGSSSSSQSGRSSHGRFPKKGPSPPAAPPHPQLLIGPEPHHVRRRQLQGFSVDRGQNHLIRKRDRNENEQDALSRPLLRILERDPDGFDRISVLDKAKNSEQCRLPTISSSSDGPLHFRLKEAKRECDEVISESLPDESTRPGSRTSSELSKITINSMLANPYADSGSPKLKKQKVATIFWDLGDQSMSDLAKIVGESFFPSMEKTPFSTPCDIAASCWTTDSFPPVEGKFAGVTARATDMESSKDNLSDEVGAQVVPSESVAPWAKGCIESEKNKSQSGVSDKELDKDYDGGSEEEGEHAEIDVVEEDQGEIVALKKVKLKKETEGFPITSLREINILLSLHHPSTVDLKEVVVGHDVDNIFVVMEYMEHDLKELLETMKQPFSQSEVKCLMLQLLEGVNYFHENWVLHRALKTSNLLLKNRGEVKICDIGLARQYENPLKSYTQRVVTLWYRAPELLLGCKEYSTAIDMWSLGCIMAELLTMEPLFTGINELDQLDKMLKLLGTPNESIWPDFAKLPVKFNFRKQPFNKLREKFPPTSFAGQTPLSDKGFNLLNRLLSFDPQKRITAEEALQHPWFKDTPLPKIKELMPATYPPTYPLKHRRRV